MVTHLKQIVLNHSLIHFKNLWAMGKRFRGAGFGLIFFFVGRKFSFLEVQIKISEAPLNRAKNPEYGITHLRSRIYCLFEVDLLELIWLHEDSLVARSMEMSYRETNIHTF